MHLADDRHHMVLAIGLDANVAQHDDLVVALDLLEGARQDLGRILIVAAKNSSYERTTRSGVPRRPSRS
jgi:hypothetical protein